MGVELARNCGPFLPAADFDASTRVETNGSLMGVSCNSSKLPQAILRTHDLLGHFAKSEIRDLICTRHPPLLHPLFGEIGDETVTCTVPLHLLTLLQPLRNVNDNNPVRWLGS